MAEYLLPNLSPIPLPLVASIRQTFPHRQLHDIEEAIRSEFAACPATTRIQQGERVAVAVGSRGIANISLIVKLVVQEIRKRGGNPFVVPAMGSHGGATAEGQRQVLSSYGITDDAVGAPIISSMDTVEIGRLADGTPVHLDSTALSASAIVPINRVKLHTSFQSEHGSGLMKMLVVGLGKQQNATTIHRRGVYGLRELIPQAARLIIEHASVPFGVAIVEDGYDQTAIIHLIEADRFQEEEKALLQQAEAFMPKLPVDDLDVLIVDEIGKNISGTGMDTNVIGRLKIRGEAPFERPRIKQIVVLGLTEASHGNAIGLGLADLTTKKVTEQIDYHSFYINVLTSTFVERGKVPIALYSDREAIQAAIATCWLQSYENVRLARIKNTLELAELQISQNILDELMVRENIQLVKAPRPLHFDVDGNLLRN
jgi:hypothetical protein